MITRERVLELARKYEQYPSSLEPTLRGVGIELKPSYYRQAVKNVEMAAAGRRDVAENAELDFGLDGEE